MLSVERRRDAYAVLDDDVTLFRVSEQDVLEAQRRLSSGGKQISCVCPKDSLFALRPTEDDASCQRCGRPATKAVGDIIDEKTFIACDACLNEIAAVLDQFIGENAHRLLQQEFRG